MEKAIEDDLIKAARAEGGYALKFYCTTFTGLPDRLVLLPGARIRFVECKVPGKGPSKRQAFVHRILVNLGFPVYVLRARDEIPAIIAGAFHQVASVTHAQ